MICKAIWYPFDEGIVSHIRVLDFLAIFGIQVKADVTTWFWRQLHDFDVKLNLDRSFRKRFFHFRFWYYLYVFYLLHDSSFGGAVLLMMNAMCCLKKGKAKRREKRSELGRFFKGHSNAGDDHPTNTTFCEPLPPSHIVSDGGGDEMRWGWRVMTLVTPFRHFKPMQCTSVLNGAKSFAMFFCN